MSEIERLKWENKHLQETLNDVERELVGVEDYQASNDCACTLTYIAQHIFCLCTKYDCPDRKNCDGTCDSEDDE